MALLISYEVQVNCVVPGLVETRWTATVSEEFSPAGSPSRRACGRRPRPGAATAPGSGCRPRRPRRSSSAVNTRSSAGSGRNPAPSAEVQFRVRLSAGNAIPGRGTVDATESHPVPAQEVSPDLVGVNGHSLNGLPWWAMSSSHGVSTRQLRPIDFANHRRIQRWRATRCRIWTRSATTRRPSRPGQRGPNQLRRIQADSLYDRVEV